MKSLLSLFALSAIFVLFQNCSGGYDSNSSNSYDSELDFQNESLITEDDDAYYESMSTSSPDKNLFEDLEGYAIGASQTSFDEVYTVTSNKDTLEYGTLRYAVEVSEKSLWIKFDPIYFKNKKRISLNKPLRLTRSDVLIDGRGANVELVRKHNWSEVEIYEVKKDVYQCNSLNSLQTGILYIYNAERIIVTGLKFRQVVKGESGYPKGTYIDAECLGDQVMIFATNGGKFNDIWIHDNKFSHCRDECISIVRANGRSRVTISRNLFRKTNKAIISGNSNDFGFDILLSMYENIFDGVNQRSPRLRGTIAHIYKNKFKNWKFYAVGVDLDTRVILENNEFLSKRKKSNSIFKFSDENSSVWSEGNFQDKKLLDNTRSFPKVFANGGPWYYTNKMRLDARK